METLQRGLNEDKFMHTHTCEEDSKEDIESSGKSGEHNDMDNESDTLTASGLP